MNDSPKKTLSPAYFDDVYAAADDPWNFDSSEYEAAKYAATIDALPRRHYESAFEIGCSIGVLTAKLEPFCGKLLAVDVNEKALEQARAKCDQLSNVTFQKLQIPEEFPAETFDLIVVSEVGYYLSVADWKKAARQIIEKIESKGTIILVHWTHFVADYPQTGDAVHDSFAENAAELNHLETRRTEDYRLDVWTKI